MPITKVNQFLGCCDLEKGGIIISFLSISISVIHIFLALFGKHPVIIAFHILVPKYLYFEIISKSIITIMLSIVMFFGILKKRKSYVMPFLIFNGYCLTFIFIDIMTHVHISIKFGFYASTTALLIVYSLAGAMHAYIWICISSLYEKLTP